MELIKTAKMHSCEIRTNLVIYAKKTTAGDCFCLEEKVHQFTLAFSEIIYAKKTLHFFETDDKVYLLLQPEYIKGKALIDVTECFEEIKAVCNTTSITEQGFSLYGFTCFELDEIIIEPEVRSYIEVEGEIQMFTINTEHDANEVENDDDVEDDNPVYLDMEQLIEINTSDGKKKILPSLLSRCGMEFGRLHGRNY